MSIELIVFALGALLLLTGIIGGGFEIRELKIPPVGRVARVFSTVVGAALIMLGVGLVAKSSVENPTNVNTSTAGIAPAPPAPIAPEASTPAEVQPTAATFKISDELDPHELSEQVTVSLNGKIVGNLTVNRQFTYSEIAVTVPRSGQYSYTIEADAYFVNSTTNAVFPYTGVGQGMIQVDDGTTFKVAGASSGNSWVVTLVAS